MNASKVKMETILLFALTLLFGCSTSHNNKTEFEKAESSTIAAELQKIEKQIASKRGTMGVAKNAMVATCHPESAEAAISILKKGGSAVDAFIAATFVDYVVAPGTTSLAGPLSILIYSKNRKKVEHLHAGLKRPLTTSALSSKTDPEPGKAVLIPGAVAGLEAAHRKYGKLTWRELLTPAIRLARDGFRIPKSYEKIMKKRESLLTQSDYGRSTYFRDGHILVAGDQLIQPEVAKTLAQIAKNGSRYFYSGSFAQEFIKQVNAKGGHLTGQDLSTYRPQWLTPLMVTYRDQQIFLPGAMSFGGSRLAIGLKLLEQVSLPESGHWSQSSENLIHLTQIYRLADGQPWVSDRNVLARPKDIEDHLSPQTIEALWKARDLSSSQALPSSHSYHVTVIDPAGNIATGTHTIESLPWSDHPIFVGGIPLNDAGRVTVASPPGTMVLEPFTAFIGFNSQGFSLAGGTFSSSMFPADLQIISNVVDFKMNAEEAVLAPRVGMYALNIHSKPIAIDKSKNLLDKRFGVHLINEANKHGVEFEQNGYVDTGMPVLVKFDFATHSYQGMTPELLDGVARGF